MWRIYTRTGDKGETRLLFGGRVPKNDPRCEAYGATDEAVSNLGLARALCSDARVRETIAQVQRELFTLGAELATDRSQYETYKQRLPATSPEMTERLEKLMDEMTAEMPPLKGFVLPGGTPGSAALDVARAVVRRAERRAIELQERGLLVNPEIVRYLNRLSDLVFILARYEDRRLPTEMVNQDDAS